MRKNSLFANVQVLPTITKNGEYKARVSKINLSKGVQYINMSPFEDEGNKKNHFSEVMLRIEEMVPENSAAYKFIKLFEDAMTESDIVGKIIGIEVKVNGEYVNVVNVFEVEETFAKSKNGMKKTEHVGRRSNVVSPDDEEEDQDIDDDQEIDDDEDFDLDDDE